LLQSVEKQIARLSGAEVLELLHRGLKGLEKESLRVSSDGGIAQTPHPRALGSALTNPYITTDYSEALIELITPPFPDSREAQDFLLEAQKFVYDNLEGELLWATSMPSVLAGGANIPIARYGDSNAGTMKTVYRRGLGHRYGRVMQVIAGVHFNYSPRAEFWPVYQALQGDRHPLRQFSDTTYLGLTRNLQRYGWLIPYLFGASPAVCKSFLGGRETTLEEFDSGTCYGPFATSLRMGDIGYTNSKEKGVGIKANYDSLGDYIRSLSRAIETPSPLWERIGVKHGERYEQLNANILQIENEYYSTVRPKQLLEGLEKPVRALERRGVRYVELRSLDINAFHPLGISLEQLRFLEVFMLFCLLLDSPPINVQEQREIDQNLGGVAHRGLDPLLYLLRQGRELRLQTWAGELLRGMEGVCEALDASLPGTPFQESLGAQQLLVKDPDCTPSAMMLAEMRRNQEPFFYFARRLSLQHQEWFAGFSLSPEREQFFRKQAKISLERQAEIEAADEIPFDQFLQDYFNDRI
jgi:glutamate--cysteine ligase